MGRTALSYIATVGYDWWAALIQRISFASAKLRTRLDIPGPLAA
jgi:hypothetical protein